nr:reverse transcriptase domain-containing protein [Tanacetum cinerariifolium]
MVEHLPPVSIDSYDDLKKAFLKNYLQQKKYIKDPIELHNIKQRDGGSTKDFVRMDKLESRDVKGALECMRIFEFVHGITNHELIKRLYDKIQKTVNEMMRVTTSFLRGEVAALNHERKKSFPPWKQHEGNQKQNFKKEVFKTNKGHNTDECMHLRKQIEEMLKVGKLSHMIKEIKQNNEKEQPKSPYNGIIGRPGVRKLQAVPSTAHGMLKILVEGGVIPQKSSKLVSLECAMVFGPEDTPSAVKLIRCNYIFRDKSLPGSFLRSRLHDAQKQSMAKKLFPSFVHPEETQLAQVQ